jgi:hypothetical protein
MMTAPMNSAQELPKKVECAHSKKSLMVELASWSLLLIAYMSAMTFRAWNSVNLPRLPSWEASSNELAILCAARLSWVPVLLWGRRPSGSLKQAIQFGELGKRRKDAILLTTLVTTSSDVKGVSNRPIT